MFLVWGHYFFYRGLPCEPVFKQVADQVLTLKQNEGFFLCKTWKMKLLNEAADDAGGVFDEVLTHMCLVRQTFFIYC